MALCVLSALEQKNRIGRQLSILSSEATRLAPLDPEGILNGWQWSDCMGSLSLREKDPTTSHVCLHHAPFKFRGTRNLRFLLQASLIINVSTVLRPLDHLMVLRLSSRPFFANGTFFKSRCTVR